MAAHRLTDAEEVAVIERRHELALLDRLLDERSRPVPPVPADEYVDPAVRGRLSHLMLTIAEVMA